MKKNKIKLLSILGLSIASISLVSSLPFALSSCSSSGPTLEEKISNVKEKLDIFTNAFTLVNYLKNAYNVNEILSQIPSEILRPKAFVDWLKEIGSDSPDQTILNWKYSETSKPKPINSYFVSYGLNDWGSSSEKNKIRYDDIKEKGWDLKTKITLEDWKRDFPNAIIITSGAFQDCSFTEIQIPETVLFLGYPDMYGEEYYKYDDKKAHGLFENMYNLVKVDIPVNNVICYGRNCFKNCINLEKLPISDKTVFIGNGAFGDCKYDPIVKKLPDTIQFIGDYAFYNLQNYNSQTKQPYENNGAYEFTDFSFPKNLKYIGSLNFSYDKNYNISEPNKRIYLSLSNGILNIPETLIDVPWNINASYDEAQSIIDFKNHLNLRKIVIGEKNASLILNSFFMNYSDEFLVNSCSNNVNIEVPDFVLEKFEFLKGSWDENLWTPDLNYTVSTQIKKPIFSGFNFSTYPTKTSTDPNSFVNKIDLKKYMYLMVNYPYYKEIFKTNY